MAKLDPAVLTALTSADKTGTPPPQNDVMQQLLSTMLQTQQLELQESQERLEAKQRREAETKAIREANIAVIKRQSANNQYKQENCAHLKEDGTPAIGGQRDHQNRAHYICFVCFRHFIGSELPAHLRNFRHVYGGPIIS